MWPKEEPPGKLCFVSLKGILISDTFYKDAMLLWRFVGKTNVILSNGDAWKRHSHVVKAALNRNVLIAEFVSLGKKLFKKMANGGLIKWDDYTMVGHRVSCLRYFSLILFHSASHWTLSVSPKILLLTQCRPEI